MFVCMYLYIYIYVYAFLMCIYVLRMYMCVREHKAHISTEFIFLKLYFASLVSFKNSIVYSLGTPTKQHFSQYIKKYLFK